MKYLIDTDIASYYLRGQHNLFDIFQEKVPSLIRLSVKIGRSACYIRSVT
jgi:hypothetical protein